MSKGTIGAWCGLAAASLLTAAACGREAGTGPSHPEPAWSPGEISLLRELALDRLPALPPDPSNRYGDDPRAAALGRRLFFDERLSGGGDVSCASCHIAVQQFQDGTPVGHGVGFTARRTMPIMGTAYNSWQFWDGRRDSQWSQALAPLESAVEHGGTRLGVVRVLMRHYRGEYEAVFGALPDLSGLPEDAGPVADAAMLAAWDAIPPARQHVINRAFANLGKSIAAFERRVGFGPSRFDRYMLAVSTGQWVSDKASLSADEQAGAALFVGKAECINCHTGPLLTDQTFHNVGVAAVAGEPIDEGRWIGATAVRNDPFNCLGPHSDAPPEACAALRQLVVADPSMVGAFKTPSLRNVADRAPYMHAGQLVSLEEVVDHYDFAPAAHTGTTELRPLRLSSLERRQLVAFLRSLSGSVEVSVLW